MKVAEINDNNISENKNINDNIIFLDKNIIKRCHKSNIVNDRFIIDKTKPLKSFSNDFCVAYAVNDLQESSQNHCYAKLFDKSFLFYLESIVNLTSNKIENFNNPIDIGIVEFHDTNEEYIAVIFNDIFAVSLGELIDKNESFSDKYIIKNILYNIKETLKNLHDQGIAHGSVNLDNIYLSKSGNFILDECFTTPFGYNQSPVYECLNISESNIYAKSNINKSSDYYALGIVCLELTTGKRIKKPNIKDLNSGRILSGSYRYFIKNKILTGTINKIIRGLLNDSDKERFGYNELSNIPALKNFFPKIKKHDFSEPIIFNNKKIYNANILSHELASNLFETKNLFSSGKLQTFLFKYYKNAQSLYKIKHLLNKNITTGRFETKYLNINDLVIAEIIKILGNKDIFSIQNLSFSFDNYSICNFVINLIKNNKHNELKLLSEIIDYQFYINEFSLNSEIHNKSHSFIKIYKEKSKKAKDNYLSNFLYALNKTYPKLPYIFGLPSKKVIFSPIDMLKFINENNISEKFIFNNLYLILFLHSKLEDDYLTKYLYFNNLIIKNTSYFKLLLLFSEVQKEYKIQKLSYLSKLFSQNIIKFLDKFIQSKKFKKEISEKIKEISKEGDLSKIIDILDQKDLFQGDKENFLKNVAKTSKIQNKLEQIVSELESKQDVEQKCMNTTLTISYLLFSIAVIYILAKLTI